jgi:hypothetical protein
VSPRRGYPHPTQPHLTTMNAHTEQKLIDHLYKCVSESSHRDELLALMYEQIQEDTHFCINELQL